MASAPSLESDAPERINYDVWLRQMLFVCGFFFHAAARIFILPDPAPLLSSTSILLRMIENQAWV